MRTFYAVSQTSVTLKSSKNTDKCTSYRSWDSVVGIAAGYGLDDQGVGVRVPVGSRISPLHGVQAGSGVYPASYPMGTGESPGIKRLGHEADLSSQTNAEVKKTWTYTSTPPYVFMA
jgi:hypothetical protein